MSSYGRRARLGGSAVQVMLTCTWCDGSSEQDPHYSTLA